MEASSSTSHFDAFASILRAYDGRRSELQEAGGDEETLVLLDDDEGIALRFAGVLEGMWVSTYLDLSFCFCSRGFWSWRRKVQGRTF